MCGFFRWLKFEQDYATMISNEADGKKIYHAESILRSPQSYNQLMQLLHSKVPTYVGLRSMAWPYRGIIKCFASEKLAHNGT